MRARELVTVITILLAFAGTASAQLTSQGIPGAECVPRNDIPSDDIYEYQGRSLTNTGSGGLDFFIAVCPVSEFVPNAKVLEFQVYLTTDEQNWCTVFDASGELVFHDYTSRGFLWIPPMPWWDSGLIELTLHCLLEPGASIDRLVIIWEKE